MIDSRLPGKFQEFLYNSARLDRIDHRRHTRVMDNSDEQLAKHRAKVFKSLAHPSRLRIVQNLEAGPRNVGELTDAVGSDISTVSKHLAILRSAGIVIDEARGRSVYYSLYCSCIPEFLRSVDEILAQNSCPAHHGRKRHDTADGHR